MQNGCVGREFLNSYVYSKSIVQILKQPLRHVTLLATAVLLWALFFGVCMNLEKSTNVAGIIFVIGKSCIAKIQKPMYSAIKLIHYTGYPIITVTNRVATLS